MGGRAGSGGARIKPARRQSYSACHRSQRMSQIFCFAQITHAMAIPDHRQFSCHRLQPYFLLLHRSKFLKKPNYKSQKEDLCQKFIFVPASSFIFFQSLFELKTKFLKIVLFQGSGGGGVAPQKPNNMHFSTVLLAV